MSRIVEEFKSLPLEGKQQMFVDLVNTNYDTELFRQIIDLIDIHAPMRGVGSFITAAVQDITPYELVFTVFVREMSDFDSQGRMSWMKPSVTPKLKHLAAVAEMLVERGATLRPEFESYAEQLWDDIATAETNIRLIRKVFANHLSVSRQKALRTLRRPITKWAWRDNGPIQKAWHPESGQAFKKYLETEIKPMFNDNDTEEPRKRSKIGGRTRRRKSSYRRKSSKRRR